MKKLNVILFSNGETQLITMVYFSEWYHCPSMEEARNVGITLNFSLSFIYHKINLISNQLMTHSTSF